MTKPIISLIVAVSDNNVIGNQGELPWRIPADLKHFKNLTMGHCLIMGRKTYDSIGKPLPGRSTIVLSRSTDRTSLPNDVYLSNELSQAVAISLETPAMQHEEIFVVGGGEIYQLALPIADRIYVTRVHTIVAGDAYFPEIDMEYWKLASEKMRKADEKNNYDCHFQIYERTSI